MKKLRNKEKQNAATITNLTLAEGYWVRVLILGVRVSGLVVVVQYGCRGLGLGMVFGWYLGEIWGGIGGGIRGGIWGGI